MAAGWRAAAAVPPARRAAAPGSARAASSRSMPRRWRQQQAEQRARRPAAATVGLASHVSGPRPRPPARRTLQTSILDSLGSERRNSCSCFTVRPWYRRPTTTALDCSRPSSCSTVSSLRCRDSAFCICGTCGGRAAGAGHERACGACAGGNPRRGMCGSGHSSSRSGQHMHAASSGGRRPQAERAPPPPPAATARPHRRLPPQPAPGARSSAPASCPGAAARPAGRAGRPPAARPLPWRSCCCSGTCARGL